MGFRHREAAEDHEIVLVAHVPAAAADTGRPMEGFVRRFLEQMVEGEKAPAAGFASALAVHLLQAQDVGAQA